MLSLEARIESRPWADMRGPESYGEALMNVLALLLVKLRLPEQTNKHSMV